MYCRQGSQMDPPNNEECDNMNLSSCGYVRNTQPVLADRLTPDTSVLVHGCQIRVKNAASHSIKDTVYDDIVTNSSETKPSQDRQFTWKCTLVILFGMFAVAVTLSVYCYCLLINLQTKYSQIQDQLVDARAAPSMEDVQTCLPCAALKLGPLPEETVGLEKLIQRTENGFQICCAKTSHQLLIMLNLYVKRKHQEICATEQLEAEKIKSTCNNNNNNTNSTTGTTPTPAVNGNISAYLVLDAKQPEPKSDLDQLHPIRNWNSELPGTHLTNLYMSGDKSKVVIPESGRYFVYSQVTFLIHYDLDPDNGQEYSQLLYQSVLRYNAIYPLDGSQELMTGVTTQCWEKQKNYGKYTTYAGASVFLNKGDQIFIKASRVHDVFYHDSMTYFGLFKIG